MRAPSNPYPTAAPERSSGRARPLPPSERRAALVAATLPLVVEHGTKVTTRQIAEAAGVAEGTIFRVFPDKEALVQAAVQAGLDPMPTVAQLNAVDTTLPLEERLVQITAILQNRLVAVFNLLIAIGWHSPPDELEKHRRSPANEIILRAVIRLLEPDRDRFRCPISEVVRVLRLLTFAGSHPKITDGRPLTVEQIVSVLLDGVRQRP
ncbi:MAG TPA: TetR/AcrR family transcriptional regulator [Micromonosporaceae bacterium]